MNATSNNTFYKIKYISLSIAFIIHAILLFLLAYYSFKLHHSPTSDQSVKAYSSPKGPAKISFNNQPISPKSIPVSQPSSITNLPISKPVVQKSPKKVKPAPSITKSSKQSKPLPEKKETKEEKIEQTISKGEKPVSVSGVALSEKVEQSSTKQADKVSPPVTGKMPYTDTRETVSHKPDKTTISGAAFMQAFRQAYSSNKYESSSSSKPSNSNHPFYLQERLNEWQDADYKQKIDKAILNAARRSRKYVYCNESFSKTIIISFAIENNTVTPSISPDQLTGVSYIDNYLAEFIASIELPRRPNRLKYKSYTVNLTIRISCPAGGNYIKLEPVN